jgi:hypothetical protein
MVASRFSSLAGVSNVHKVNMPGPLVPFRVGLHEELERQGYMQLATLGHRVIEDLTDCLLEGRSRRQAL